MGMDVEKVYMDLITIDHNCQIMREINGAANIKITYGYSLVKTKTMAKLFDLLVKNKIECKAGARYIHVIMDNCSIRIYKRNSLKHN